MIYDLDIIYISSRSASCRESYSQAEGSPTDYSLPQPSPTNQPLPRPLPAGYWSQWRRLELMFPLIVLTVRDRLGHKLTKEMLEYTSVSEER